MAYQFYSGMDDDALLKRCDEGGWFEKRPELVKVHDAEPVSFDQIKYIRPKTRPWYELFASIFG